jgi:imidazolonepropionase-like amidohydrolase
VSNLLVRGAAVLDVRTGTYEEADVRCVDGRVAEVGPRLSAPDDVPVLDGTGGYLLPGLIDCHVHVTAGSLDLGENGRTAASYVALQATSILRGMLRRGFTTVRDMGGADHGLARAQVEGLYAGPRLLYCGSALSQTGGHGDFREPGDSSDDFCGHSVGRVVDGVDEVRRAARDELRRGATHLKVMASGGAASPTDRIDSTQFSEDELRAAVEEAEAANRYVAAHAYTSRAVSRALRAGVRSIEHGNLADDATLALLQQRAAFLVPTLVTYVTLKRVGLEIGQSRSSWEKIVSVLDAGMDTLDRAHRAGVQIAFGTDLLGPTHPHQNEEFTIRGQVQPPLAVLQGATLVAARLVGQEGRLGEVTNGAHADLLLLDRDPLSDLGVLADPERSVRAVVQAGSVVG